MFDPTGDLIAQPQVEESYNLSQFCTCEQNVTCDVCEYFTQQEIERANRAFRDARIVDVTAFCSNLV